MINENELKGAMTRNGYTQNSLATALGVNTTTLWRKLHNRVEFTLSEINTLSRVLKLSKKDKEKIFFA